MLTYYLVKSTHTATPKKAYRYGDTETYLIGKGDLTLYAQGTFHGWCDTNLLTPFFVKEYGYMRESDARRNWSYRHPENSDWWTTTVEIVPIHIDLDATGREIIV